MVEPGTYHEDVTILRGITLTGQDHSTINASQLNNGIVISLTSEAKRGGGNVAAPPLHLLPNVQLFFHTA